jgi:hypothetical protein
VALGCNTAHVVATQGAAASHLCCAEADVPEGSSGDTDVGLGMDLVPVQMWAGDGLFRSADVGVWGDVWVWWGGGDSVQLQMWVGGGVGAGADVGLYEPSPVVSDERSPQTQMRAKGRAVPKHTLRCAHTALRCAHTALQRMPLRATAGGAMQRGGALLPAALRCIQFRSVRWGPL